MIGYVTIGTNDLARARAFYDALLSLLGAKLLYATETMVAWGTRVDGTTLMVTLPYDRAAATVGNGGMVALSGSDRATVDAVHAKAIELGARDEGPPGPRGTSGFYAGYFRDLDGNKLNAYVAG
jgi:catechol 2,3-dioxygenase-like lactoylglutathione lyase family enzyme